MEAEAETTSIHTGARTSARSEVVTRGERRRL